jgi:putative peptide maturation dehydrogenase
MKFRRCQVLFVEPQERAEFSLENLLEGGGGLHFEREIMALAGHLDGPCRIDGSDAQLLLECSAQTWQDLPEDPAMREQVLRLIDRGLLVGDDEDQGGHVAADNVMRASNWWPLGALFHRHSRWSGVNSVSEMERHQLVTAQDLVRQLGAPPEEVLPRRHDAVALPRQCGMQLDEVLLRRVTCRNFDVSRPLPLSSLAGMLEHVLMARSHVEPEPGVRFLKKNVPSAGGLHPMEAYVLVQAVEGLEAGLYHYHPVAHELGLVSNQPESASEFARRLLSGQHWFADAHVLVILVCRFERNFWKYRQHAKAYRAVTLDAGHISQAIYTAATEQGLGAFVTAAINESEAEHLLGLEPMREGPLAVCGFGWRSSQMQTAELDPARRVWNAEA